MMQRILLCVLCLLVLGHYACAQSTTQGRVLDAHTKEPLEGVSVQFIQNRTGTLTGAGGAFSLSSGSSASDSLYISQLGYKARKIAASAASQTVLLQPSENQLDQVVVSASRDAQARTAVPVAITSLSSRLISETKPVSLEQVLNKVSGVYMVNLGNEQHTMAIRQPIGYKSLFLYLEDGIPIRTSGDFNHNALIEINMAALKTIEVIRGPASSLYGSEAVGGAVNFITQAPSQVPVARLQAETSNRGYRRTDFSASGTAGKLGIFAGGYYATQRKGFISHSDFHKLALTLRTDYRISNRSKLVTSASLIDYHTDQTGGLDSTRFYARNYSSLQTFTYRKVRAFRLRSTLEHEWNTQHHTQLTLFYRNNAIGQNPFYLIRNVKGNAAKATGEVNTDAFRSYGMIAQHRKSFNFLQARLIGGLSADYSPATYTAHFINIDRNSAGMYSDYTRSDSLLTNYAVQLLNTAAYAQFEVNPTEKLKVVAALRYDRLDYNFDNYLTPGAYTGAPDERNGYKSFSPKLGFTYALGSGIGSYANYSVGFAPPQITELYRGVQVPSLKPAYYTNYEAGGWLSFAQQNGYLDVSVFQLRGRDEIISVRLPDGAYQNQNAGKTRHYGVEYTLRYAPRAGLGLRVSGTNARHQFVEFVERGSDFSTNEMATAPRFIANSEVTWKPAFVRGLRMGLEWQHLGKYFMDAANTTTYGGYNLLHARTGYTFRGLEVWLNVLNLTNTLYATTAEKTAFGHSYRQGNPRTMHLGVGYSFAGKTR